MLRQASGDSDPLMISTNTAQQLLQTHSPDLAHWCQQQRALLTAHCQQSIQQAHQLNDSHIWIDSPLSASDQFAELGDDDSYSNISYHDNFYQQQQQQQLSQQTPRIDIIAYRREAEVSCRAAQQSVLLECLKFLQHRITHVDHSVLMEIKHTITQLNNGDTEDDGKEQQQQQQQLPVAIAVADSSLAERRHSSFPSHATTILRSFFSRNSFPTSIEKYKLSRDCEISYEQVQVWFINQSKTE